MKEIGVGIRIDVDEGLSFSGIEEVNGLINRGGRVVSIVAGGAVMRELRNDGENSTWTLSGCEMKVIVDDSDVASSPQTLEHNRLFQAGCALVRPYLQFVDMPSQAAESRKSIEELNRGIVLLEQAIKINPANWSAYWMIGKTHQALGSGEAACHAFGKSYALHKGNPDVAREYMFECLKLGRTDRAIAAARHAVTLKTGDSGLVANLGLALFIGGKLDEAAEVVATALAMTPNDPITLTIRQGISDVQAGRKSQPSTMADLGKL